ncbi:SDR family oxidoreductase [Natrialbaceae archaeon A-gly3]
MSDSSERPVVLITGCSSGIGRATAARFLAGGWHVWATARDTEDVATLKRAGCRSAPLDVTDEEQVEDVVSRILDRDGRIDCLVNNAGYGQPGAIEEIPIDHVHAQFDVNVYGPLRLVRAVLPHMRDGDGGTIVNVSSMLGRVSYPARGIYAGSKHALEAISDALRAEVQSFDVDVVLVEPGVVDTGFEERLEEARRGIESRRVYGQINAIVDLAQRASKAIATPPDRVAGVVYEAATVEGPRARYVVGLDARLAIRFDAIVPARVQEWIYARLF